MSRDRGMTLLEVMFAISILLIGVGFIVKSDGVMYKYRDQREVRQQMHFYAAGQLERVLRNQPPIQGEEYINSPFEHFKVISTEDSSDESLVSIIKVEVSVTGITKPPEPVTLYMYRVK